MAHAISSSCGCGHDTFCCNVLPLQYCREASRASDEQQTLQAEAEVAVRTARRATCRLKASPLNFVSICDHCTFPACRKHPWMCVLYQLSQIYRCCSCMTHRAAVTQKALGPDARLAVLAFLCTCCAACLLLTDAGPASCIFEDWNKLSAGLCVLSGQGAGNHAVRPGPCSRARAARLVSRQTKLPRMATLQLRS